MAENVTRECRWLRIPSDVRKRRERRRAAIREQWADIPREIPCSSNDELANGFDRNISTRPATLVKSVWGDDYGIDLYGRLGLHCYNFQKEANYKFNRWEKYSTSLTGYIDFYVTLEAKDPACDPLFSFQILVRDLGRIDGIKIRWMTLACRIKCNEDVDDDWDDTTIDPFYKGPMPEWLSDANLAGDNEKYYVVQKSELRGNDWLQLLSEIAIDSKQDCSLIASQPFEIKRIVVQTNPEAREKLKEANAIFYITLKYNDSVDGAVIHNAIIRKTMDGKPGHMCLEVAG